MPIMINDMTLEPKATPPAVATSAPPPGAKGGGKAAGPELERELEKIARRDRERSLRLRAW